MNHKVFVVSLLLIGITVSEARAQTVRPLPSTNSIQLNHPSTRVNDTSFINRKKLFPI